ncbi:hypothetical protein NCLIV_060940 [Neospora caninum Liverpool]|uniref:Uncharacterized protein n=1 Tax=Neospora caninum (strain Liverpool) TaxID=572307 RepID=F0VPM3_NEOCL|nr:hypothetical protein NCLIV_060940 [Neospora caninum Liverpool]CBZ55670.1 hypothetical protein NCLIV_060940 [Neospora caninum Liverpool]CEL70412.1 TPA: hypothetical protein BN1204_060940 [Neospora caninum Liverpool]|eukprot:XP_003885696.1 hypothetical protein NCLIV_060940 [Neospora caninum Liverpool]
MTSSPSSSLPPELPGLFWDPERRRYFPLASRLPPATSAANPEASNPFRALRRKYEKEAGKAPREDPQLPSNSRRSAAAGARRGSPPDFRLSPGKRVSASSPASSESSCAFACSRLCSPSGRIDAKKRGRWRRASDAGDAKHGKVRRAKGAASAFPVTTAGGDFEDEETGGVWGRREGTAGARARDSRGRAQRGFQREREEDREKRTLGHEAQRGGRVGKQSATGEDRERLRVCSHPSLHQKPRQSIRPPQSKRASPRPSPEPTSISISTSSDTCSSSSPSRSSSREQSPASRLVPRRTCFGGQESRGSLGGQGASVLNSSRFFGLSESPYLSRPLRLSSRFRAQCSSPRSSQKDFLSSSSAPASDAPAGPRKSSPAARPSRAARLSTTSESASAEGACRLLPSSSFSLSAPPSAPFVFSPNFLSDRTVNADGGRAPAPFSGMRETRNCFLLFRFLRREGVLPCRHPTGKRAPAARERKREQSEGKARSEKSGLNREERRNGGGDGEGTRGRERAFWKDDFFPRDRTEGLNDPRETSSRTRERLWLGRLKHVLLVSPQRHSRSQTFLVSPPSSFLRLSESSRSDVLVCFRSGASLRDGLRFLSTFDLTAWREAARSFRRMQLLRLLASSPESAVSASLRRKRTAEEASARAPEGEEDRRDSGRAGLSLRLSGDRRNAEETGKAAREHFQRLLSSQETAWRQIVSRCPPDVEREGDLGAISSVELFASLCVVSHFGTATRKGKVTLFQLPGQGLDRPSTTQPDRSSFSFFSSSPSSPSSSSSSSASSSSASSPSPSSRSTSSSPSAFSSFSSSGSSSAVFSSFSSPWTFSSPSVASAPSVPIFPGESGFIVQALDASEDVLCTAARLSPSRSLEILVGGSSPAVQLFRLEEGSSRLRLLWRWRPKFLFSSSESARTGRDKFSHTSTSACFSLAWTHASCLPSFSVARTSYSLDSAGGPAPPVPLSPDSAASNTALVGLRNGGVYLIDVRAPETQSSLCLLSPCTPKRVAFCSARLGEAESETQGAGSGSSAGKRLSPTIEGETGGCVTCIRPFRCQGSWGAGTAAVVARGKDDLLLLDARNAHSPGRGEDAGTDNTLSATPVDTDGRPRKSGLVTRYLPCESFEPPREAPLSPSLAGCTTTASSPDRPRTFVFDRRERILFSSSPSRGLLLFHWAQASSSLAARAVNVYGGLLRRLFGFSLDSTVGEEEKSDRNEEFGDASCRAGGKDERDRLERLEREIPFELYGTCATAPRLEQSSSSWLEDQRGSENTCNPWLACHDEARAHNRPDSSRCTSPIQRSSFSASLPIPSSAHLFSSCPSFSGTRSGGRPYAESEVPGTDRGRCLSSDERAAGPKDTIEGDRRLASRLQMKLADLALLPEGFFVTHCTSEGPQRTREGTAYSDIVVRWPGPAGSSFSSSLCSSPFSSPAFDPHASSPPGGGDPWGVGALTEGLLLHGESEGSHLGDVGESCRRPARAGGDVFVALSSWGFHLLSSIDRHLQS